MKILHNSYEKLCDSVWQEGDEIPRSGVIHVHGDNICAFFRLIEGNPYKYVIVSSNSDYGFDYQLPTTVESDMGKYFNMINTTGLGYETLVIPSRHRAGFCKIQDKYCVKMYSWTRGTFDKIPDNVVKWFSTNNNLSDDRIVRIPFGVSPATVDLLEKTPKKDFGIYINFQSNTLERLQIKKIFQGAPDVLIENEIPHDKYVERLKEFPFVFSLPGNGYDCYRSLEAIYCNAIPIIPNMPFTQAYDNLKAIKTDNYISSYEELRNLWENKDSTNLVEIMESSCELLEYWENEIKVAGNLLFL